MAAARTGIFFFFNDTATTENYTLSLHDALPIWTRTRTPGGRSTHRRTAFSEPGYHRAAARSEEHTSELQSHHDLVCRLLLEKKKKKKKTNKNKKKKKKKKKQKKKKTKK